MDKDLQFDRADYATPGAPLTCTACKAVLTSEYWSANGQVLCSACAEGVRRYASGTGSRSARFLRALLFGTGAALVCAALYGAVLVYSRSEWAIISIGIGWLVGKAVRHGSDGRGGWRYQLLAAFLTYTAVCAAYLADVVPHINELDIARVAWLVLIAYALPFMGGFQNILGLLIIAFGVWQAWVLNRPLIVEVTGPHPIGGSASARGA